MDQREEPEDGARRLTSSQERIQHERNTTASSGVDMVPEDSRGLPRPRGSFLTAPLQVPDPSLAPLLGRVSSGVDQPQGFYLHGGVQVHTSASAAAAAAALLAQARSDTRRRKPKKDGETGTKKRARKPADSPRRPKSAYMFFLASFREVWKKEHPESKKVADVARAAGERWRAMSNEDKAAYERLSSESKALYAREMEVYRSNKEQMRPGQLGSTKGEQSAYFYFLRDFREAYKREHPEQQMDARNIAKQAADTWKSMTPEERDTFEKMAKSDVPSSAGISRPSGQEGESRERYLSDRFNLQVPSPQQENASIRHPSLESLGVPGNPVSSEAFPFEQPIADDQANSTNPADDQSMHE